MALGDWLTVILLSVTRIACAARFFPPFSESVLVGPTRQLVVLLLALPVFPMVSAAQGVVQGPWQLVGWVAKEVVVGCCVGFLAALPFRVIEMVGNLMDNQRGATMGEIFSPMSGSQEAPLAQFLLVLALAVFYLSGAVLLFLEAVYGSFRLFPVTTWLVLSEDLPTGLLGSVDGMMRLAVVLAAPVVLIMVLATLGLGLVNRSAPQLNVFFLSMPVKSALGIGVLLLGLRFLLDRLEGSFAAGWLHLLAAWFQEAA